MQSRSVIIFVTFLMMMIAVLLPVSFTDQLAPSSVIITVKIILALVSVLGMIYIVITGKKPDKNFHLNDKPK